MNLRPALISSVLVFAVFSCKAKTTDEETLLRYAQSSAEYSRGNFEKVAVMLAGSSRFAPALVLRGKALYFSGGLDEAEQSLRRALKYNPRSAEASLFLARILREQGREDEARETSELLIRDNPQDTRALRLSADLALQRGDTEDAAALLDRAVEASAETALVFIDRARLRWSGGNGAGALEDLGRAEALLPSNSYMSRSIGELRFRIASAVRPEE
jgi:tetratricopeptide (TPR) repeat protein